MHIEKGSVRPYRSPVGTWVWIVFGFTCLTGLIFAALCSAVYSGFLQVVDGFDEQQPETPNGVSHENWCRLFWGAAVSAAFAFVMIVAFHSLALFLLVCSCHSLGHPGRGFGRAFIMAASFWTSFHVLNVALQFASFEPLMSMFNDPPYDSDFNRPMLTACVATGIISSILYLILGLLMLFWKEHPDLMQACGN
eukprot:gene7618-774_t